MMDSFDPMTEDGVPAPGPSSGAQPSPQSPSMIDPVDMQVPSSDDDMLYAHNVLLAYSDHLQVQNITSPTYHPVFHLHSEAAIKKRLIAADGKTPVWNFKWTGTIVTPKPSVRRNLSPITLPAQ